MGKKNIIHDFIARNQILDERIGKKKSQKAAGNFRAPLVITHQRLSLTLHFLCSVVVFRALALAVEREGGKKSEIISRHRVVESLCACFKMFL